MKGKPLVVCGAYRPTNRDIQYQEKLCNTLTDITRSNSEATVWFAGDLNLPDIDWDTESMTSCNYPRRISECMLDTMHDLSMEQIVNFSTRGNNILEVFMTNTPSLVNRCEPVPGVSDHETAVFIEACIVAKRQKCVKRKIHLWKKGDINKIREEIEAFTDTFMESYGLHTPVEQLWSLLKNKLNDTIEKHIPSKMTTTRPTLDHTASKEVG